MQQNFKAIQSRLEFLKELIESYSPAAQNGLSLQAVMPMLLLGANSSNAATRTVAIDVWGRLYSTYGREMDAHLKSGQRPCLILGQQCVLDQEL